jgi:hypothetical protein
MLQETNVATRYLSARRTLLRQNQKVVSIKNKYKQYVNRFYWEKLTRKVLLLERHHNFEFLYREVSAIAHDKIFLFLVSEKVQCCIFFTF